MSGGPSDITVLIMVANPALIKEKHIAYAYSGAVEQDCIYQMHWEE